MSDTAKRSFPATYVEGFHDADDVSKMCYRPLGRTGMEVSVLSLGASSLGSVFRSTTEEESINVVHQAIKSGINYIDVAPWYGHGKAETVLGKALKGLPRESYYITTKVGRYLPDVAEQFDFSAERTLRSVDESLARLGLDYVDIIQVHDMEFASDLDVIINETLPALQSARQQGKARFVGITGYPLDNFRKVIDRSGVPIDTVLTYCRCSMNDTSLLDYVTYFQEKHIGIVNASPISMGLLSDRGPPAWHPGTDHIKDVCAKAAKYCQEQGVDISRLAMKFTLGQKDIATTLVSTASIANLQKNIQAVYEDMSPLESQTLDEVMARYMTPLKNANWEGIEVNRYRKELLDQK